MPPEGFKTLTIPEKLYLIIKERAEEANESIAELLAKCFSGKEA